MSVLVNVDHNIMVLMGVADFISMLALWNKTKTLFVGSLSNHTTPITR